MLTPLQALSLTAKGPFPSLPLRGGGWHPARVPPPGFSHSVSVLHDFGVASSTVLMCVKKMNRPERGLPAGSYSVIQLEFRDESGSGEQPREGITRGLL